jgi:uncharacterized BrkB/YihY/UPF0761 family membrane protein
MLTVRAGLAVIVAGLLTIVFVIFLGALVPIWLMMAIYGMQALQDAPAHGGGILFATLPIAGMISIPVFVLLAIWLYQKFKSNDSKGDSLQSRYES